MNQVLMKHIQKKKPYPDIHEAASTKAEYSEGNILGLALYLSQSKILVLFAYANSECPYECAS